ncbi:MAG: hypothetical protein MJZ19_05215 [Paludibacteraceae bacterium]|nr:hypothetical protein [Paludibacteraceae bacterium]
MSCSISRACGLEWTIRHDESGVKVNFIEGTFNVSQRTEFGNVEPDALKVAIMREIADWAKENVNFIALYGDVDARESIISDLSEDLLIEAAEKLKGVYWYEDATDFADDIDLIEPSEELREVLELASVDELEELLRLVKSYWVAPYDIKQWAEDVKSWLYE